MAFRVSRVRERPGGLRRSTTPITLPPMATSVPGLYVVNSAQIVNGTLNVNETVKLAEDAFDRCACADRSAQRQPHAPLATASCGQR